VCSGFALAACAARSRLIVWSRTIQFV
jgi:hypothetical protein